MGRRSKTTRASTGQSVREPCDIVVVHQDEQVDVAPVVELAAAERADQGRPLDGGASLKQPEQLTEEAVAELAEQRRPGCH